MCFTHAVNVDSAFAQGDFDSSSDIAWADVEASSVVMRLKSPRPALLIIHVPRKNKRRAWHVAIPRAVIDKVGMQKSTPQCRRGVSHG